METPATRQAGPDRLSDRGRTARLVATALGLLLLFGGTIFGTDDDFPFGPFRMFATTNRWDEPISIARAEVLLDSGERVELTPANSGVRRAEVEGQLERFKAEPQRLAGLADAWRAHHPGGSSVRSVAVYLRHHELSRRGPTGHYYDEQVATWDA
ncbi:hypothetical protein Val02_54000 [Virgisporangium aliadipatigenens]|uniref:Uncharacterized protein n=1 Tax=Virgisporangium aliadipatigenens TaxID=741659 RepID=A0A8J3YMZ7_9ACTN|nr:hypothetical protein [Virgisporangium aliadipatigenens]GIJ48514.1 hypothetical protein Val02_54000 [Virgisporangium aliadipatigenens]